MRPFFTNSGAVEHSYPENCRITGPARTLMLPDVEGQERSREARRVICEAIPRILVVMMPDFALAK